MTNKLIICILTSLLLYGCSSSKVTENGTVNATTRIAYSVSEDKIKVSNVIIKCNDNYYGVTVNDSINYNSNNNYFTTGTGLTVMITSDKLKTINVEEEVIASKETTLNYDSFRPIKLIIKFSKDGIEKTYYKQIILAVCKQEDYDVISSNNIKTIDEVYRKLDEIDGFTSNIKDYVQTSYSNGYTSNIRQK